jgi:rhodanese-related sulfurtransferase
MGEVSTDEARKLVASNEVEVIDLRDEEGWVKGHIPGAHRAADDLDAKLEELPDDRKLLVVCGDGKRSGEVAGELDGDDREAVSLAGGMEAWLSDGLPSQPSIDYEPGPDPAEVEDSEKAAEVAEGTIDTDSDGSEDGGSGETEGDSETEEASPSDEDSSEEPQKEAEEEAGEPVEGASGDASPQQDRSSA